MWTTTLPWRHYFPTFPPQPEGNIRITEINGIELWHSENPSWLSGFLLRANDHTFFAFSRQPILLLNTTMNLPFLVVCLEIKFPAGGDAVTALHTVFRAGLGSGGADTERQLLNSAPPAPHSRASQSD